MEAMTKGAAYLSACPAIGPMGHLNSVALLGHFLDNPIGVAGVAGGGEAKDCRRIRLTPVANVVI